MRFPRAICLVAAILVSLPAERLVGQPCPTGQCPTANRWEPRSVLRRPVPKQATRPITDGRAAIVKISSRLGNTTKWGSGTHVGRGVIVTCAHILRTGWTITIHWQPSQQTSATLLTADGASDFAVLQTTPPDGAVAMVIANGQPAPGETVGLAGFPGAGNYQAARGRVIGWRGQDIVIDGTASDGMSGGPIFNSRGLIGVLTEVESHGRVRRVLGPGVALIAKVLRAIRCRPTSATADEPAPTPGPIIPKDIPAPPESPDLSAIVAELQSLRLQVEAIEAGPPGPPGKDGEDGRHGTDGVNGRDGLDGKDAEPIGIDVLVAEVLERLPPPIRSRYPASYDVTPH